MTTYEQQLIEKIEDYREKMIQLAKDHSINEKKVIKVSTALDELINEYQQINK